MSPRCMTDGVFRPGQSPRTICVPYCVPPKATLRRTNAIVHSYSFSLIPAVAWLGRVACSDATSIWIAA